MVEFETEASVSALFGRVQLYNLCKVFKPIAIVRVNWLWTVLLSTATTSLTYILFFFFPFERVSSALAVDTWERSW